MFVKADNRSFQQELAQEASSHETKDQNQEAPTQDQPTTKITAAALSQMSYEPRPKRKHSIGSSVATNGSVRSDLADVELTFDDSQAVDDDLPQLTHQHSDSRPSKLGDVVESLSKCQTHEYEAPEHGEEEREKRPQGDSQGDDNNSDTNTASPRKKPEMTELKGTLNPFLIRPEPSTQNLSDMMDLDTDYGPRYG